MSANSFLESQTGERLPLPSPTVIGRVPDCNIQIAGAGVSRRHALIHTLPDTGYWIVDLNSTNGVKVNGARITGSHRLRDGDLVGVGVHVFTYRTKLPQHTQTRPKGPAFDSTIKQNTPSLIATTGILLLGPGEQPQYVSDRANAWLQAYFPTCSNGDLPPAVLNWIKSSCKHVTSSPLIVANENSYLMLRLAEHSAARSLVVLREVERLSAAMLSKRLTLSIREGETLFWVAEGKSNPEIALILAISSRTVENHLASIYTKLGVENRHAATCLVLNVSDSREK